MKKLSVLCLFVCMAIGGLYANPDRMSDREHGHGHSLEKFKETLKLSDEQARQVDALNKTFKEKHISNKDRLHALESAIKAAQSAQPKDYERIQQLLTDSAAIQTQMRLDKMKHKDGLMGLLNSEQRTQLEKHMKEKYQKMKDKIEDKKSIEKQNYE